MLPCAVWMVMNDPNMHARGTLEWQHHPEFGRLVVMHSPMRYEGVTRRDLRPSRPLGADTAAVLNALPDIDRHPGGQDRRSRRWMSVSGGAFRRQR